MAEDRVPFLTALPAARADLEAAATAATGRGTAPVVILGAPLDRTTSYRSGTAGGPAAVRAASWSLETYSPALGGDLEECLVYDFGDVALDSSHDVEADLQAIERAVAGVSSRGCVPVVIGGEHLVTLPAYRAVARAATGAAVGTAARAPGTDGAEPPVLFHYDAHADLREEFEGLVLSHATVIRHVAAVAGGQNVYQFGIRSGSREEMFWGEEYVNRPPGSLVEATRTALRAVAGRRVYLTLDIDLLDPAHAPGTGNPEPGGPAATEVLKALAAVGAAAAPGPVGRGIDLVGADLVEVSPPLDPTGRTAVLAAKLLRELLIARAGRPGGR